VEVDALGGTCYGTPCVSGSLSYNNRRQSPSQLDLIHNTESSSANPTPHKQRFHHRAGESWVATMPALGALVMHIIHSTRQDARRDPSRDYDSLSLIPAPAVLIGLLVAILGLILAIRLAHHHRTSDTALISRHRITLSKSAHAHWLDEGPDTRV
jgi:hypothetical protein